MARRNRFKSILTWVIFFLMVASFYYLKDKHNVTLDEFSTTVVVLSGILMKFAFWNNPKDPDNF